MTRLQKIAYVYTLMVFLAGLTIAGLAQYSVSQQNGAALIGGYEAYADFVNWHIALLVAAFPSGVFAIAILNVAKRHPSRRNLLNLIAICLMITGFICLAFIAAPISNSPLIWFIGCGAVLAIAFWCALVARNRAGILLCAVAIAVALFDAILFAPILKMNSAAVSFYDTYSMVAFSHQIGLVYVFSALSILASLSAPKREKPSFTIAAFFTLAVFIAGASMLKFSLLLGLQGLPRRYASYPEAYASSMQQVTEASLVLAVIFSFAMIIVTVRAIRPGPSDAQIFE